MSGADYFRSVTRVTHDRGMDAIQDGTHSRVSRPGAVGSGSSDRPARVQLVPGQWVDLPGTRVQVQLVHGDPVEIEQRRDGTWELFAVPGVLLTRSIAPDGRPRWPWPVTPLPLRR